MVSQNEQTKQNEQNEQAQTAVQPDTDKAQKSSSFDERYQLPRTISPIGLFFGHGASDPRRAKDSEKDALPAELSEADIVRERYITKARTRAPIGTIRTRPLISLAITIACGAFYLIILQMPLNPQIPEFWVFLGWLLVVYIACMMFMKGTKPRRER